MPICTRIGRRCAQSMLSAGKPVKGQRLGSNAGVGETALVGKITGASVELRIVAGGVAVAGCAANCEATVAVGLDAANGVAAGAAPHAVKVNSSAALMEIGDKRSL